MSATDAAIRESKHFVGGEWVDAADGGTFEDREVKGSGFCRFGGTAVIDEFTEARWITVRGGSHPFQF